MLAYGVLLGAITLAGCGATSTRETQPDAAALVTVTATTTSISPTIVPPSPTLRSTPTLPPTVTPTPTPTATPTPTPTSLPPTRIAVIGDYGLAGEPAAQVASLVKGWNPDVIITLGDNNYPHGASSTIDQNVGQYYHDFIAPYNGRFGAGSDRNRFFPVLGNHDWEAAGAKPYLDYFTLPDNERYYAVTAGSVRLFALDSYPEEPDGVSPDSRQAVWLRQALEQSTACWNIVYMHHAPFSSGLHGSSEWMQWPFQAWGADAVLGGHDHHYERIMRDGLPYIVNGLGGGARYPVGKPVASSVVQYRAQHGAMLIEATSGGISFQFVTHTGETIDTYEQQQPCRDRGP